MDLTTLIFVSGLLHFATLLGSAAVPFVLDWRKEIGKLEGLSRELVWVHGGFIVLTILGFGVLTCVFPGDLASGAPLARGLCAFIAIFWGTRVLVQFFIFDAKPYLTNWFLVAGYHGLTLVFLYQTAVLTWAAVA